MTKFGPMDIDFRKHCTVQREIERPGTYYGGLRYNTVIYGLSASEVRPLSLNARDLGGYSYLSDGGRSTYMERLHGQKTKHFFTPRIEEESGEAKDAVAPDNVSYRGAILDRSSGEAGLPRIRGKKRRPSDSAEDAGVKVIINSKLFP